MLHPRQRINNRQRVLQNNRHDTRLPAMQERTVPASASIYHIFQLPPIEDNDVAVFDIDNFLVLKIAKRADNRFFSSTGKVGQVLAAYSQRAVVSFTFFFIL